MGCVCRAQDCCCQIGCTSPLNSHTCSCAYAVQLEAHTRAIGLLTKATAAAIRNATATDGDDSTETANPVVLALKELRAQLRHRTFLLSVYATLAKVRPSSCPTPLARTAAEALVVCCQAYSIAPMLRFATASLSSRGARRTTAPVAPPWPTAAPLALSYTTGDTHPLAVAPKQPS